MTTDFSLTDKATWITLLTWIAAIVAQVFHTDLSALVPAAAWLAAGIVTAVVAHAKHNYQAAVTAASAYARTNHPSPPAPAPVATVQPPPAAS